MQDLGARKKSDEILSFMRLDSIHDMRRAAGWKTHKPPPGLLIKVAPQRNGQCLIHTTTSHLLGRIPLLGILVRGRQY